MNFSQNNIQLNRPSYSGMPGWSDFSLDVSISISIDEAKKGLKANTAGFWINNKMMKINDDGGNDNLGLLWRKAMMMMRKPWRHWLERREPMLNQMVRQPQKSLSFSSLSWPGSTTSTTKVAWLYFKTHNKGKLLCHYFQIWTSFQTIGQLLKTLTGFVQLCRDMLVTNMKLMRREKYVLSPEFIFFDWFDAAVNLSENQWREIRK